MQGAVYIPFASPEVLEGVPSQVSLLLDSLAFSKIALLSHNFLIGY